jgi:hypothetical protein
MAAFTPRRIKDGWSILTGRASPKLLSLCRPQDDLGAHFHDGARLEARESHKKSWGQGKKIRETVRLGA